MLYLFSFQKQNRSPDKFNVHDLPSPVLPDQRSLMSQSREFQQETNFSCSGSIQNEFVPRNFDSGKALESSRTMDSSRLLDAPRPHDTPRPHDGPRLLDQSRSYGSSRTLDRTDHMRGIHGGLGPPPAHISNVLGRVARSPSEGELSSESSSLQAPDLPFQLINRAKCS